MLSPERTGSGSVVADQLRALRSSSITRYFLIHTFVVDCVKDNKKYLRKLALVNGNTLHDSALLKRRVVCIFEVL